MSRRVVITGLGTVNPLGDSVDEFYRNLVAGKSGIRRWKSLDLSRVENKVGGDLGDYDRKAALEAFHDALGESEFKRIRKLHRTTTFSGALTILSALQAYRDSGLLGVDVDPHRTSVVLGGHNLNSNYIAKNAIQFLEEPEYIDPLAGVEAVDINIAALVAEVLKIQGPTQTVGGACASGNLALRDGFRDIVTGETDRSVCTGAVFDVAPADIQASVIINSVVVKAELQEDPTKASRPFDTKRNGFVYSHGSGTIVLEELETALKRGAPIYGELLAVSANNNANHLPMPGAEKQTYVMVDVLKRAGVRPEDVDYVNCHATGTPAGDLQEIRAVKAAFGDHAKNLKVNAPKSMLGHTAWASPIVETIGGLMQMKHGVLHPTINIEEQDPEIDLDICANEAREHQITYMLKNSFGFGGINAVTLIRRFDG